MDLSDIHQDQLARFNVFFKAKRDRSFADRDAEKNDYESDRLVDESALYNVPDVRNLLDGYHQQTMARFREELEESARISNAFVQHLLAQAQASGLTLQVGDISAEWGAGASAVMGAPPLVPKAPHKLEAVDAGGVTDPAVLQVMQDQKEELRQLKDRNIKMQTDMSNIAKERSTLAAELEQVKANLKEQIVQRHEGGGGSGNEVALRQMLDNKEAECEAMKRDLNQRLADSQQFKQLKQLVQTKTQQVKEMKQTMASAGLVVPGTSGEGIELEADSD